MRNVAPPPAPGVVRVIGLALIAIGVILYVLFGVAKGSALDAGPWTLLAVFGTFGIGCLILARKAAGPSNQGPPF